MKIEVVEFYPDPKKKLLGTMHMYLIDEEMDLRGVGVFKTPKSYFIQPPSLYGPDGERYGCIAYTNQDKQTDFMKSVIRAGIKYMKKLEKKK